MNEDNDDEDIQSPTENSKDLNDKESIEEPITNDFIVPIVTSFEDNNTSTQSELKSTQSSISDSTSSISSVSASSPSPSSSTSPETQSASSIISIRKPYLPTSLPIAQTKTTISTSKSTTTSTATSTTTTSTSTTASTSTTTSTLFSFDALSYSEDDESDFDWSSDYEEIEKFSSEVLKVHKKVPLVTEHPKTAFPVTNIPILRQTDLNMYQELIAAREKRKLFVYNHGQCISYKNGSKPSSHIKVLPLQSLVDRPKFMTRFEAATLHIIYIEPYLISLISEKS